MMRVILVSHTPNPEKTIVRCARICYSPDTTSLFNGNDELTKKDITLLDKLVKSGHHSTLENASFTFLIEGISRITSHQLVRHRMASYCQKSQRYVEEDMGNDNLCVEDLFVIPDSMKFNPEVDRVIHEAMSLYMNLIASGVSKEDARYILPHSCKTSLTVTMNARELIHVSELRCCNRAQWEIRDLATKMVEEVEIVAPILASYMGPTCKTHGSCDEESPCNNPYSGNR
jgi:thymidylate synthase (FAD)